MEHTFVEGAQYQKRNGQVSAELRKVENKIHGHILTDGYQTWALNGRRSLLDSQDTEHDLGQRVTVTPYAESFPRKMLVWNDHEKNALERIVIQKMPAQYRYPFFTIPPGHEENYYAGNYALGVLTGFKHAKELPTETKPLRKVEDLGKNTAIHTRTKQELDSILALLKQKGINPAFSKVSEWGIYENDTCLFVVDGAVYHGESSHYRAMKVEVVPAADFLPAEPVAQEPVQDATTVPEPVIMYSVKALDEDGAYTNMGRYPSEMSLDEAEREANQLSQNNELIKINGTVHIYRHEVTEVCVIRSVHTVQTTTTWTNGKPEEA